MDSRTNKELAEHIYANREESPGDYYKEAVELARRTLQDKEYTYTVTLRVGAPLSKRDLDLLEEHLKAFLSAGENGEATINPHPIERPKA